MFSVSAVSSFRTSGVLFGRRCRFCRHGRSRSLSFLCDELNPRTGSVAVDKDLVSHAAHIRFADGVDLFQLAKQLSPVAESCLVFGQLTGEAFVVGEAAQ